jgi:serine/threonine-protein kinase RsbW
MVAPNSEDSILKQIHIKVATDAAIANQIMTWFEALNHPPLANSAIWWQCQTAFKEAFDNVFDHAHKDLPPETPIEIEAIRFLQRIEIRIWDYGDYFDLQQTLKDLPDLAQNLQSGGRGLKLIAKVMDDWSYMRTDDERNCLLLIKQYEN